MKYMKEQLICAQTEGVTKVSSCDQMSMPLSLEQSKQIVMIVFYGNIAKGYTKCTIDQSLILSQHNNKALEYNGSYTRMRISDPNHTNFGRWAEDTL